MFLRDFDFDFSDSDINVGICINNFIFMIFFILNNISCNF